MRKSVIVEDIALKTYWKLNVPLKGCNNPNLAIKIKDQ